MRVSTGCKTCKARHRKCDGHRPRCVNCTSRGLKCEGYATDFRWRHHAGRADRSDWHLKSASNESTGTQDAVNSVIDRDEVKLEKAAAFEKFARSGHQNLVGLSQGISEPGSDYYDRFGRQSPTLYAVCVAVQMHFDGGASQSFHQAYEDALALFQEQLARTSTTLSDPMLRAGLLLCSIEILQGNPWTAYMKGLGRIYLAQAPYVASETAIHFGRLMETLGVMDIPAFVLGRQTESQALWHRYRAENVSSQSGDGSDRRQYIEPMSRLPKTLVDLFINEPSKLSETDLWMWPGMTGSSLECQLWTSYQIAGILDRRLRRTWDKSNVVITPRPATPSEHLPEEAEIPVATSTLISRCLSALSSIYCGAHLPEPEEDTISTDDFNTTTCITYPLFITALHVYWVIETYHLISARTTADTHMLEYYQHALDSIIKPWYDYVENSYVCQNARVQRQVIDQIAKRNAATLEANIAGSGLSYITVDDFAKELGREIALF